MTKNISDQLDEALRTGERANASQEVRELVDTAGAVRRLASRTAPAVERKDQAFSRLQSALSEERLARQDRGLGFRQWRAFVQAMSTTWLRPGLAQAAVAMLAIVVTGGVLLGASATGADIPLPFGDSDEQVKAVGVITAVSADTIIVRTETANVEVTITDSTLITDDDENDIMLDDLVIGQAVEVKGLPQPDNAIQAGQIRVAR